MIDSSSLCRWGNRGKSRHGTNSMAPPSLPPFHRPRVRPSLSRSLGQGRLILTRLDRQIWLCSQSIPYLSEDFLTSSLITYVAYFVRHCDKGQGRNEAHRTSLDIFGNSSSNQRTYLTEWLRQSSAIPTIAGERTRPPSIPPSVIKLKSLNRKAIPASAIHL